MRAFEHIPAERFDAFHREFHGDTWDVCTRCGGQCEINKIGSLMPGEAEYIAASRKWDLDDFRARYLDGIATPYGVVDVLKIQPGCGFLDADFKCTIPDVKVVLCDVYPVVFGVEGDTVRFELDPWCPIVRFVPELARIFETGAIPAVSRIGAPVDWYRAVELYDSLCVDYHKLFALRASDRGYVTFTLDQIRSGLADDAPPPVLRELNEAPLTFHHHPPSDGSPDGPDRIISR
jgi:Fe-S-cluster containining protein